MAISLDDLFDQEERALQIAHEQWLNDPVAQAEYRKQRERDRARAERELANAEPTREELLDEHDDYERRADLRDDDPEEDEEKDEGDDE
mgnify:CR=1 FL=1